MRMVATFCLLLATALTGCADDPEPMSELERHIFENAIALETDPSHILGGEVLAADNGRYEVTFPWGLGGHYASRAYFYRPGAETSIAFSDNLAQTDPLGSGFDAPSLRDVVALVTFQGYGCFTEANLCKGPTTIRLLVPENGLVGAQNESAWVFLIDEFDIAKAMGYDLDAICSGENENYRYIWLDGWFDCSTKVLDMMSNDPRLDPETRLPVSIVEFDTLISNLSRTGDWTMHYESPWEDEIERRVGIMMGNYRDPVPAFSGVREHIFAVPPPREDDEASRVEADRMEDEADRLEADAMED